MNNKTISLSISSGTLQIVFVYDHKNNDIQGPKGFTNFALLIIQYIFQNRPVLTERNPHLEGQVFWLRKDIP